MKKYFASSAFLLIIFNLFLLSCSTNDSSSDANVVVRPSIRTTVASLINQTSATTGGNLISSGGGTILARGICYSLSPNPTIEDTKISNPGTLGTFECRITGLTAATQYYVRAYATNSAGTSYGAQITFTTTLTVLTAPTITTVDVTAITQTSATSGGNVTSDGGATIVTRGICWATTENPTTSNNVLDTTGSTGSFVIEMANLEANTVYYVRAFATNSVGISYGNQVTFTTTDTTIITTPEVTTTDASNETAITAESGGNVLSTGGAPLTARGICWSTTDNPSITDNVITDSATTTGEFTSTITGLTPGTVYFVRAFATNSAGTAYGDLVVFSTL